MRPSSIHRRREGGLGERDHVITAEEPHHLPLPDDGSLSEHLIALIDSSIAVSLVDSISCFLARFAAVGDFNKCIGRAVAAAVGTDR